MKQLLNIILLIFTTQLVSCGGGGKSNQGTLPSVKPAPSFNITLNESEMTVNEQSKVHLTFDFSSNSTDLYSILWQQIEGVNVNLGHPGEEYVNFSAPIVLLTEGKQKLVFKVTVTGEDNTTVSEEVVVYVKPVNKSPTLSTTVEYINDAEQSIIITAFASDEDGTIEHYKWQQKGGDAIDLEHLEHRYIEFSTVNLISDTLSFSIAVTDNEGETVDKELSINTRSGFSSITTKDQILTTSGVTTIIEWQSTVQTEGFTFELVQMSGEQTIEFHALEKNGFYFDAPLVQDTILEYQLSLNVTDANNFQFSLPITLTINPSDSLFGEPKRILAMNSSGVHVNSFSTADIGNDGVTDIIAYQNREDDVFWFKNNGDFNINSHANVIIENYKLGHYRHSFFKDVNNDSLVDFVFLGDTTETDSAVVEYRKYHEESGFSDNIELFAFNGGIPNIDTAKLFITPSRSGENVFALSTKDNRENLGFLSIAEQKGDNFDTFDNIELNGGVVNVQSCQLANSKETTLFIHLVDTQNSVYIVSAKDDYQSAQLISTNSVWSANILCYKMPGKSPRLFINYGYADSREVIYSDENGFEEINVSTGLTGGGEANLKQVDINKDGINEVVSHGTWGGVSNIFTFDENSTTDLFKPTSNVKNTDNCIQCQITYWHESDSFHLFRNNNNRFELSEPIVLNQLITFNSVGFSFKAPESINNVDFFANKLVINTNLNNGRENIEQTFSLDNVSQTLSIDAENNIKNFGDQVPTMVDFNDDQIIDMVYTQRENTDEYGYFNDCRYRSKVDVVVRYGSVNNGFSEPEILNIETECPVTVDSASEQAQHVVIQDINLDGQLDLGIRDSYSDYFDGAYHYDVTNWWIFDSIDGKYLKQENPVYNTDPSTYPQTQKIIADVTGDGMSDVLQIDQPVNEYWWHEDYLFKGLRGVPSVSVSVDAASFTSLVPIDENALFTFIYAADVNLDGQLDYVANAVFKEDEIDKKISGVWYRWNEQGEFEKTIIPSVTNLYVDLHGTGESYFVDNEQIGKLIEYRYDERINKPIVKNVTLNEALPIIGKRHLVDIDKDGDLDIIFWNTLNVYMMENLNN